MVKIFVGNLTPKVTVDELRALFEQHGKVSECDIIRNYGFVHMDDEEEAKKAFDSLNNFSLQGRQIHLEYSTSKLRKAPGMDDVCFRCGAKDHKTTNCPVHDGTKPIGGNKRPGPRDDYPPAKFRGRPNDAYFGNRANNGGGYHGGGGYAGHYSPPPMRGAMYNDYYGRGESFGGAVDDSLIPRPPDRLLSPLYEEYLNARERYYYYRDRLERELYAMRRAGAVPPAAPAPPPPSARVGSGAGYGTLMSSFAGAAAAPASAAVSGLENPYGGRSRSPSSIVRYPELYYAARASGASAGSSAAFGGGGGGGSGVPSSLVGGRSLYDPYPFKVEAD